MSAVKPNSDCENVGYLDDKIRMRTRETGRRQIRWLGILSSYDICSSGEQMFETFKHYHLGLSISLVYAYVSKSQVHSMQIGPGQYF
jgi:hypothetical protein